MRQKTTEKQKQNALSQAEKDAYYMREALKQAKKAALLGETPIGCVIVRTRHVGPEDFQNGKKVMRPESFGEAFTEKIIARGYNRRNTDHSALAHAEVSAIRKATKVVGDWRLEGCTMYVTLEPCQMCAGAIVQSRIERVVIGAMNPKAGCAGSVLNLLEEPRFNHQAEVVTGVLKEDAGRMLKEFFSALRRKDKDPKEDMDAGGLKE